MSGLVGGWMYRGRDDWPWCVPGAEMVVQGGSVCLQPINHQLGLWEANGDSF